MLELRHVLDHADWPKQAKLYDVCWLLAYERLPMALMDLTADDAPWTQQPGSQEAAMRFLWRTDLWAMTGTLYGDEDDEESFYTVSYAKRLQNLTRRSPHSERVYMLGLRDPESKTILVHFKGITYHQRKRLLIVIRYTVQACLIARLANASGVNIDQTLTDSLKFICTQVTHDKNFATLETMMSELRYKRRIKARQL